MPSESLPGRRSCGSLLSSAPPHQPILAVAARGISQLCGLPEARLLEGPSTCCLSSCSHSGCPPQGGLAQASGEQTGKTAIGGCWGQMDGDAQATVGHVSAMWPPERVGGLQGASPALNLNQLRPPCLPTCPKTPSKPQPAPPPALPLGPWPWQFFAGCQVPGDLGLPVATGLDDPASSSPPAPTKRPEQALQQGCTAGQGPELYLGRTSRLGRGWYPHSPQLTFHLPRCPLGPFLVDSVQALLSLFCSLSFCQSASVHILEVYLRSLGKGQAQLQRIQRKPELQLGLTADAAAQLCSGATGQSAMASGSRMLL